MEWEDYCRQVDVPDECPICGKPSSLGAKLKPFCCTAHRDQAERENLRFEQGLWLCSSPQKGDHVKWDGLVHVVGRTGDEVYTACDQIVPSLQTTKEGITCLTCLVQQ